jgi:Heterokaryon incompatibility protein (HET)
VIDAICINQRNIPERNEQVKIIREIYHNAKGVVAWLGPDMDEDVENFEVLEEPGCITGNFIGAIVEG